LAAGCHSKDPCGPPNGCRNFNRRQQLRHNRDPLASAFTIPRYEDHGDVAAVKTAPQITLSKVGPVPPNDPTIEPVTPDQFTITISNSNQAGKYKWRARGTLLH
jgi:hypothetical protein